MLLATSGVPSQSVSQSHDEIMPYTLSREQVASYHADGYLILRAAAHSLVSPAHLQQWTAEVKGWPKVKGKWMPYEERNSQGQMQLMRTEKFVDYHSSFYDFLCGSDMANLLNQLSGDVSSPSPT